MATGLLGPHHGRPLQGPYNFLMEVFTPKKYSPGRDQKHHHIEQMTTRRFQNLFTPLTAPSLLIHNYTYCPLLQVIE